MTRSWALSFLGISLLASCGGRSKLSDEQKLELTKMLESTGRSQRATQALSYAKVRDEQGDVSLSGATADETTKLMEQKLAAATCDRTQFVPETDSGSLITKPVKKGYVVEGPSCPVNYRFLVTRDETQKNQSNVHVDLSYAVNDDGFKALNDVTGYSLVGDLNSDGENTSGELKGSVQSQVSGNVPMEIHLDVTPRGGELAIVWEFPKFSVEMKAVGAGGKIDYSLNGEALTSTQFLQTLAKAGPAFSQFIQINAGSTAGSADTKPQTGDSVEHTVPAPATAQPLPPPQTN